MDCIKQRDEREGVRRGGEATLGSHLGRVAFERLRPSNGWPTDKTSKTLHSLSLSLSLPLLFSFLFVHSYEFFGRSNPIDLEITLISLFPRERARARGESVAGIEENKGADRWRWRWILAVCLSWASFFAFSVGNWGNSWMGDVLSLARHSAVAREDRGCSNDYSNSRARNVLKFAACFTPLVRG